MAAVKSDKEKALPNAKILAERVIQNCGEKLRLYLTKVLKNSDKEEVTKGSAVSLYYIDYQTQVELKKALEFEEGDAMGWVSRIELYPTISSMEG